MRFESVTGVVNSDEKSRFERMLFRSTRGNCYIRFAPIEQDISDPETGGNVHKHVFIIFFKSAAIERKVRKICDAFSAHRYSVPSMEDPGAVQAMLDRNAGELSDSHTVLSKNQDTRFRMCQMLAACVEEWKWKVLREKSVYHSLNMFSPDVSGMLRGEGWIIASELPTARAAVTDSHAAADGAMPSLLQAMPQPWPSPPTHFTTNQFTYAYQEFVNTYGVPRYREANPALFTAATFPFLFGVMYGDIGHGTCLLLGGLYLMSSYDSTRRYDEMTGGMYSARFMITAMGFFGIYAGMVYNDFFSLGLNLFTSRWYYANEEEGASAIEGGTAAVQTSEYGTSASIYPFGMDPAWHVASNELLFFNSFKMKLSVILGIAQMFMGTMLKGANALYFNEKLDFFFEFLPMVAFSCSLFVYMVILIVIKWSINWNSRMLSASCVEVAGDTWGSADYQDGDWVDCGQEYCTPWGYACELGASTTAEMCPLDYGGTGDGCQPPNLITLLINIALQPGNVDEPLYKGQAALQNFLLLVAFVSVPVLLLAKPYLMSKQHAPHGSDASSTHSDAPLQGGEDNGAGGDGDDHDGESHSFGELIIHQAIETIEFVLGMVSNTASYLRLWALSLAHSKLAGVFWEKAMLATINMNFFAAFLGFGIFAAVTTGVLLMMDVLECFLHALRLHWVEFQNKFFKADGVRFVPFSFAQILRDASAA
jgi:V-type H+-transporting ATPase subunit a